MRLRVLVAAVLGLSATTTLAAVAPPTGVAQADPAGTQLVINEVYGAGGNSGAVYNADFVELYNPTDSPISLDGLAIHYRSAGGGSGGAPFALEGEVPAHGYWLIQMSEAGANGAALPTPDQTASFAMAAAGGQVALQEGTTIIATSGDTVGTPGIIDFFGTFNASSYETAFASASASATQSLNRAAGADTDDNSADFTLAAPSPQNSGTAGPSELTAQDPGNQTYSTGFPIEPIELTATGGVPPYEFSVSALPAGLAFDDEHATISGTPTEAGDTVVTITVTDSDDPAGEATEDFTITVADPPPPTPIGTVQGTGATTPLAGQIVQVQGVVVGDYEGPQGGPTLRGFYLQSVTPDDDPLTSEGIFVFNNTLPDVDDVDLGDLVSVVGQAGENQGQTQITAFDIRVDATGQSVTPTEITLPWESPDAPEAYEGMLVTVTNTLYVTEYFQTARFAEIVTSTVDHLPQPTAVVEPGTDAIEMQAANDLTKLVLDDGLNNQNPDPLRMHVNGELISAGNPLRGGDTIENATGVLTYTWAGNSSSGNKWRLRPTSTEATPAFDFTTANPRPDGPPDVGSDLTVAGFNVLNYFVTVGSGPNCGTDGTPADERNCRGASNPAEYERQHEKLIAALVDIDADIYGFAELENTTGVDPLAPIIADLNDAAGADVWESAYDGTIGDDVIKVGVIYRTDVVELVGTPAILDASFDPDFDTTLHRPSLAASFEELASGEQFTVVVNHWKSKGSCPGSGDDADQGDGASCWNAARTRAAEVMLDWVATAPTGIDDDDVLVFGDLNSYAMEDPIRTLIDAGWVDVVQTFNPGAHSYVFDGQWGTLDYALASPSLAAQVSGADDYHINADELPLMDYNLDFQSPGQAALWYAPDRFRTSDHDPAVVGLALGRPVPTVMYAGADPTNAETLEFIVDFTEPVVGFDAEDVTVDGIEGALVTSLDGGDQTFTVTVSVPAGADGDLTVRVEADGATDADGNPNAPSAPVTVGVDRVAPTVGVEYVGPDPTNAAGVEFAVTFSEPVVDFVSGDVEVSGLTVSDDDISIDGEGAEYVVTVTVPLDTVGDLTVSVPADVAQDEAGNPNVAGNSATVGIDREAPTVTLTYLGDQPTNAAELGFEVAFSEPVDGFSVEDLQLSGVPGATVTTVAGTGADYTVTVTVPADADGTLQVHVPLDVAFDAADNGNISSAVAQVEVDRVAPAVVVSPAVPSPTSAATVTFDVSFTEPVNGFTVDDLEISGVPGALLTAFVPGDEVHTVTVAVPEGAEGTLALTVPAGAVEDLAGNPNAAGSDDIDVDRVGPTVTVLAADPEIEIGQTAMFNVEFSEPVADFTADDLIIAGTGVTPVVPTGIGTNFIVMFPAVPQEGTISLAVQAGAVTDPLGNPSTASGTAEVTVIDPNEEPPPPPPPADVIVPVEPARYWDTRAGEPTFDGQLTGTGGLAADQSFAVQIGGRGSVPADAVGVAANLTVITPDGPGFATLYACADGVPKASHLNYLPGEVVANNVVVPLDAGGAVCVYTKAGADFVLDVNGYVPADSPLVGIEPTRYADTRTDGTAETFDDGFEATGLIPAEGVLEVQVGGRGLVPAGAQAVFVNVTAVGPADIGYLRLFPCGEQPDSSTLNYAAGQTVPNGALAALSPDGRLCIMSKAAAHVIVDVAGYLPAGAEGLVAFAPERFLDTRPGEPLVDGTSTDVPGRLAAEQVIEVQIVGRGSVPPGAAAALFNVTVVNPDGPGFVQLFPCGARPQTSNVNHATAGGVRANNALTKLSDTGSVCVFTKAGADVILDVTGWVS